MYSFDHDLEEFVTIGLGVVSKNGLTILKPGSGVIKLDGTWHHNHRVARQPWAQAAPQTTPHPPTTANAMWAMAVAA